MKRFLAFFLSFVIVFSSTTAAYANTSVGGWSALDVITAGATNTINATKTAGGKALKSSITVAASASKVGKYLIKGGGQAAIAYAMVELADGAIDWVLDPANNSVRWKDPTAVNPDAGGVAGKYWQASGVSSAPKFGTAKAALDNLCLNAGSTFSSYHYNNSSAAAAYCKDGSYVVVVSVSDPSYVPGDGSNQYKSIPIDAVAAKVIANAEAGHAPSQEAVKATALEGFAAGEHDAALDAAATEVGTENPPETENPPKDPAEPFDPAGIISAINALKALLAGILSAITSLSDFFTAEPEPKPEDNTVDVEQLPNTPEEVDISFGGACPADLVLPVQFVGQSFDFRFSYSSICNAASIIKPVVLIMASLSYVFIVSGTRETE